jgi:putative oxidoreductase
VVGFLFWLHSLQKLFGMFGFDEPVEFMSRIGAAAVIETVGGPLIILGLFTRPVAFILAGEMAVAYFTAHMPKGLWPIMNGGGAGCVLLLGLLVLRSERSGLIQSRRTLGTTEITGSRLDEATRPGGV